MNKILAVLLAAMLGFAPVSFAATTLTDKQLDQVNAGDYVILQPGETVEDVYASNNTIDLKDSSQTNIQAVSNANVVDSAVAVQTNIATNVGVAGTIAHSNVATAINGL